MDGIGQDRDAATTLTHGCATILLLTATWFVSVTAAGWSLEAQNITVLSTFSNGATSVTFRQPYPVPPVVIATATTQGGDPSDIFILNITTTGFQIMPVEPNSNDGPHIAMTLAYVAVEPGVHSLPDGTLIEAALHSTSSVQHGAGVTGVTAWDTVLFNAPFTATPAVVASLQTHNNESATPPSTSSTPFLSPAVQNLSAASLQLALERSESGAGSVTVNDSIGYIAIENNATGSFFDNNGNSLQYEGFIGPNAIRGWSNGCFTQPFNNSYSSSPRVVATKVTRVESDGGWLRRCSLNANRAGYRVDEDRDNDNERSHVAERGALLVFERDFDARFLPDLLMMKSMQTLSDPYSTSNPKAIPGATINYQVTVTNQGYGSVDLDSTIVSDPIPVFGSLVVQDIGVAGSGPVIYTDGSEPSSLNYSFIALNSTTDDVSFSNNNGTSFVYTPSADANGVDSTVTHIQINPKGTFNGLTGTVNPSMQLQFQIRVD